jgi:ABC-2 type transport system ATP-binding protein
MIKLAQITKTYGSLLALDDVSLNIEKGMFFGLLGPNGAGKTTLMNILIGYVKPDSGHKEVLNEIVSTENIGIRKLFGYVPQEISLFQELSALQNLQIFGKFYDLTSSELNESIERVLGLVQLSDRRNDKVKNFSGGMKRRLNLAASILHNPEVILCDEPTVGIDPQSRNAIFELLIELNRSGKTIVYTTHYMEEAEILCNKMAIIDHGKIIAEGNLNELIDLLDRKETIKIRKTSTTQSKIKLLEDLGSIVEHDYFYELQRSDNFSSYSSIFKMLEDMKIPPQAVEISRASLQDVFLHLTGRSLRD